MSKSPDAFRTISEVAEWLGVQAHVLRFWESKFSHVKPVKRAGGRRYYRPADMLLLGGIKKLLHDDGMTIKGVQKLLREQGVQHVSEFSQGLDDTAASSLEDGGNVVRFNTAKFINADATQITMDLGDDNTLDQLFPDLVSEHAGADDEETPDLSDDDQDDVEIVNLSPSAVEVEDVAVATATTEAAPSEDDTGDTDPASGTLSALADTTALSPKLAAEIAPLAEQLKDWLSRQAG